MTTLRRKYYVRASVAHTPTTIYKSTRKRTGIQLHTAAKQAHAPPWSFFAFFFCSPFFLYVWVNFGIPEQPRDSRQLPVVK